MKEIVISIHDNDCGSFVGRLYYNITMSLLLCKECNALRSFLERLSCLGLGDFLRTISDSTHYKCLKVMTLHERTLWNECGVFFPRVWKIIDNGGLRRAVGIVISVNGVIEYIDLCEVGFQSHAPAECKWVLNKRSAIVTFRTWGGGGGERRQQSLPLESKDFSD